MPALTTPTRRKPDWSERGSAAVDHGDLEAARQCFAQAVRAERGSAAHRYNLALVLEAQGDVAGAAAGLTEALRLDPGMVDAARRLSLLAGRYEVPGAVALDMAGLKAALAHNTVDREPIAEAALRRLAAIGPLGHALAQGRGQGEGWDATARALCRHRTAPLLKDELLLAVLRAGTFRNPELERLLTALRRVLLLEVPPERLEDRALFDLALALAEQCGINEHVWVQSPAEACRVGELRLCESVLLGGDVGAGRTLLLLMLYRPLAELLGTRVTLQQAEGIRPRALRDVVMQHLETATDERARSARMPRLGAFADATVHAVARQYEASPYPRWTSVGVVAPAHLRRMLGQHFRAAELAFLDRPFEVLIAGCGTGQQAVQAALAYGPQARVLAIDLSAASLAYAARMAERYGAGNIAFAQADLQSLADLGERHRRRFDVIECTGVLHHLADPFDAWRRLLGCLAKDGRMLVGLYSATARGSLRALRDDPAYPGPGCPDTALRQFRQVLLERASDEPGGDLKASRDFYTTSNFRDLALHVSERPVTLPEVARFLAANSLVFRGFQVERGVFARFQAQFPGAAWPGSLERWAEFEAVNPATFNGMYNFWCALSGRDDDDRSDIGYL
jgi:SAM-dependent methyltransferase